MPLSPRLKTPAAQRSLIAVIMGAALVLMLSLAYGLSVARAPEMAAQDMPTNVAELEQFQLTVPEHWQRDAEAEQAIQLADAHVLVDPMRPQRRLLLAPLTLDEPPSVVDVLEDTQDRLLSPAQRRTWQSAAQEIEVRLVDGFQVVDHFGISQTEPGYRNLHLFSVIGTGQGQFIVIYLYDRSRDHIAHLGRQMQQNMNLIRAMQQSARVEPQ